MATPVLPSAEMAFQRPFLSSTPFAPAGMTGAQTQGLLTQMQGLGMGLPAAQAYMSQIGGLQNQGQNLYGGITGMYGAASQMTGQAANGYQPGLNQAYGMAMGAPGMAQPGMMQGAGMFQPAAGMVGNTLNQWGGGYNQGVANTINQTGASFDPFNNPALSSSISEANKLLARDFNQTVMPELNRNLVAAGPGAYGGTRAGVAQGMREQSLADAMQRQTTDMMARGYESGLNRYVQDRGTTVQGTLEAGRLGGQLGMTGAQTMGQLGQGLAGIHGQLGQLGLSAASTGGNIAGNRGQLDLARAGQIGNLASSQGAFGQGMLGTVMPSLATSALGGGMLPGQIVAGMGGMLGQFGQAQQANNQGYIDWLNRQAAEIAGMPDQRLANYNNAIGSYLQGGVASGQLPSFNPTASPVAGALEGAGAGLDLWKAVSGQNSGADILAAILGKK